MSSIISVQGLSKLYPVAIKEPGLAGTLQHFLKRRYRTVAAVQSVSFEIQPGEVVGFLGPNGAGKTTTLKMLTGLIHPSGGQLRVAGQVPFRRSASFLRQITLVMGQKQQLIWDLPALDSLRINAAVYGISDADLKQRVGELSEMLNLGDKLNSPVRKLSLGERMKAELLAALIHRPQVLFLDEPTLGLDVNAQISVRDFLQSYNQRYGATVLLTSHYMADITALCQRVLVIYAGQLIYDGSLDGLLERFAPCREIRLELAQELPLASLQAHGEVKELSGRIVRFLVPQAQITQRITEMLARLEVIDLAISEPPIESVIGQVFQSGIASEG